MPDNMYVWMDGCRGSEASTPDRDQTEKREATKVFVAGSWGHFWFGLNTWRNDKTGLNNRTALWSSHMDRVFLLLAHVLRHHLMFLLWQSDRTSSPVAPHVISFSLLVALVHPTAHNSDAAPRSSSQWNADARLQRRRAESGCSRFSTGDSHLQQKVQLCFLHILGKIVCTWLNRQPSFSKQGPHAENTQW